MQSLLSYARSTFWIAGILQVLVSLYLAGVILWSPHGRLGRWAVIVPLAMAGLGALSCRAAAKIGRQRTGGRFVVVITSLQNLFFFPFGTVAALVGLYWCWSEKARRVEALVEGFEHKPQSGDGTNRWLQKAAPVLGIVVWIGCSGVTAWWGKAHHLPVQGAISGLPLLILCDLIAVFCHELGHALAGWAMDQQLTHFAVGPVLAARKSGRWTFRFSLAAALCGAGGSVASAPLHLRNLRRRMAVEIAGGPIASLVTTLLAAVVLFAAPGSTWEAWWKIPAMVAAISASMTVLNSIPFAFAAGYSDGALLMQLLFGGRFADLREALKVTTASLVSDIRLRDLDQQVLTRGLHAATGNPEEWMLRMLNLIAATDRRDLTQAQDHLAACLALKPKPEQVGDATAVAEFAIYITYLDGHAGRGADWLRESERMAAANSTTLGNSFDYWLATVAVRTAEGRQEEADHAHGKALALANRRPDVGVYRYERELLETIYQREWLRGPVVEEVPELAVAAAVGDGEGLWRLASTLAQKNGPPLQEAQSTESSREVS